MSTVTVAEQLGVQAPPISAPGAVRRLLRRPSAVIAIAFLILVVGTAIVAPIVFPDVNKQYAGDFYAVQQGPSWNYPLGTDSLGRDVLERVLVGTRPTVVAVLIALCVAGALALPLGLAAGYFGGRFDRSVGWLTDLSFAMPGIALILVILAIFPGSMTAGMITLGVLAAPALARIIRSATLPVREELYVAAARVSGLSQPYIIARHVLPRIAGPVIVLASLFAAGALLAQTGLAYLGLIGSAPAPSWGGMVAEGIEVITQQPWLIWPPGLAMTLTILAFGLLGDAVRDTTAEAWSVAPASGRKRPRPVPAPDPVEEPTPGALLSVQGLTVGFPAPTGMTIVVEGLSFEIHPSETVGVIGESGSGKTMTAMAVLGLLPGSGEIVGGRIGFNGRELTTLTESELERVRGREIALVSQEPMVSLNPVFRVGWQIELSVRKHLGLSRSAARKRTIELLRRVHLPEPEVVARRYPHELSGGMAQRVAIARALAGEPKLLIADEPTTALDVTVQAEILELLRELRQEQAMAVMLITHDWGVIADLCDRAVVMYAGQVVEEAPLVAMFERPLHPYTEALLGSNPHHAAVANRLPTIPGSVPRPGDWPPGCHFHPRCVYATTACREGAIPVERPSPQRQTRCIHYERLVRGQPAVDLGAPSTSESRRG